MERFRLTYYVPPEELQGQVCGTTRLCKGKYSVYIDSTPPAEEQDMTLRHELAHIALDHFSANGKTLRQIEEEAVNYAAKMTDEEFQQLMSFCTSVTRRGKDLSILSP